MFLRSFLATTVLLLTQIVASASHSQPFIATLTLDGRSHLSFGGERFEIPEGEIRFYFKSDAGSGAVGFVVRPSEALLSPIPLRFEDESLELGLARQATGNLRVGENGRLIMEVDAYIVVTLNHPEKPGSKRVPIRLTTEQVTARGFDGSAEASVSGTRTTVGGRSIQLVGAATNAADDYPRPGAPVTVLLSGSFDRLPNIR
jgi:hypothetical protein